MSEPSPDREPDTAAQFRDLLVAGESLRMAADGRLVDRSEGRTVTIGLTDRRLVTVSEAGGFLAVGYDAINSIRSRPQQSYAYRGLDYRFVALLGGIGTLVAAAGLLSLAAEAGPGIVAFLTIGGLVPLVVVRRRIVGNETLEGIRTRVPDRLVALGDGGGRRGYGPWIDRHLDERRATLAVGVLLEVLALLGLYLVTGHPAAPLLGAVAVGGVGVSDYALRHRESMDGVYVVRQEDREVVVNLVDGRSVRLRIDAATGVDRELSRVVSERSGSPVEAKPTAT